MNNYPKSPPKIIVYSRKSGYFFVYKIKNINPAINNAGPNGKYNLDSAFLMFFKALKQARPAKTKRIESAM